MELYEKQEGSKFLIGVSPLLGGSSGDLIFFKGYYYLSRLGNDLVRFKLNSTQTELFHVESVGTMNTQYDDVWGVLTTGTSDCNSDNLKLLAFDGNTVYDVNPENAY